MAQAQGNGNMGMQSDGMFFFIARSIISSSNIAFKHTISFIFLLHLYFLILTFEDREFPRDCIEENQC